MQKRFFYERTKRRLAASILIGMLAAILTVPHGAGCDAAGAWWGILYPQYCCAAQESGTDDGTDAPDGEETPRVKIKFRWLHGF